MRAKIVLLMILTALAGFTRAGDKLSSLQVGSQVFSNVTITKVDVTDIFFTHSAGLANVKIKDLSPELQKQFNFDPSKAKVEEFKQAGNKTNYHNELLRQPAPKVEDAAGARTPVAAGIYGEVTEEYAGSTVTRSGEVSPLTSIRTIDGQNLDFRGQEIRHDFSFCRPSISAYKSRARFYLGRNDHRHGDHRHHRRDGGDISHCTGEAIYGFRATRRPD